MDKYNTDMYQAEENIFVKELIYKNIELMTENIKLALSNKELKERVEELEGLQKKSQKINYIMKEHKDCVVVLMKEAVGGYKS